MRPMRVNSAIKAKHGREVALGQYLIRFRGPSRSMEDLCCSPSSLKFKFMLSKRPSRLIFLVLKLS
ncbi:unnamed protein product [Musa acuminata subsp. malaccensis]|uniref:(wild Malaysian banana) hypothetical protein n=1 Tax=Musa acuminata subsp. malaccensis TaxID=214687 RepID=A0A804IAQ7_MUSAM|nr:unnamed protein product [Musa acuminata subsp. malaccensis]